MRIGLNLLHCHQGIGGTWNYVGKILKALGDANADNEYLLTAPMPANAWSRRSKGSRKFRSALRVATVI